MSALACKNAPALPQRHLEASDPSLVPNPTDMPAFPCFNEPRGLLEAPLVPDSSDNIRSFLQFDERQETSQITLVNHVRDTPPFSQATYQKIQKTSLVPNPIIIPTTFPRFNELAKELRLMIWAHAIKNRDPRIIEVVLRVPDPSVCRDPKLRYRRANLPLSGIFFANHESRTVAFESHVCEPLILEGHLTETFVDYERDMIFISLGPWEAFYLKRLNCPELTKKCRRLALTYDTKVLNILQSQVIPARIPRDSPFFSKFTRLDEVAMIEWGSYSVFSQSNGKLGLTDLEIAPVSEEEEMSQVGPSIARAKIFLNYQARCYGITKVLVGVAQVSLCQILRW